MNEVVQIVLYKLNSLYGEDVIIRLFLNFNGIIPYNDSGAIEFGGDYEPLNLLMVTYGPLVPAPWMPLWLCRYMRHMYPIPQLPQ